MPVKFYFGRTNSLCSFLTFVLLLSRVKIGTLLGKLFHIRKLLTVNCQVNFSVYIRTSVLVSSNGEYISITGLDRDSSYSLDA